MNQTVTLTLREVVAIEIGKGVLAEYGFDFWPVVDKVIGINNCQFEGGSAATYYGQSALSSVVSVIGKLELGLPCPPTLLKEVPKETVEQTDARINQAIAYAQELENWLTANIEKFGDAFVIQVGPLTSKQIEQKLFARSSH